MQPMKLLITMKVPLRVDLLDLRKRSSAKKTLAMDAMKSRKSGSKWNKKKSKPLKPCVRWRRGKRHKLRRKQNRTRISSTNKS